MKYQCKCIRPNLFNRNYGYWEDRNITSDETTIFKSLLNKKISQKQILHIGIGNSQIAKEFSLKNTIYGVSISQKEIIYAKTLSIENYHLFLSDKYSLDFKNLFPNVKFDYIIDTNLKSYSCCNESFYLFMDTLFYNLKPNGFILTSRSGMNWFKKLKPKLSFNLKKFFHYKLKEIEGDPNNKLTIDELKILSDKYNIELSINDKMCYLKKK
jgi:hypothetical protein|tara:strand:+ start:168 stop:803 length:636 start_codon:yes stop_codon:yes gene_type:complete